MEKEKLEDENAKIRGTTDPYTGEPIGAGVNNPANDFFTRGPKPNPFLSEEEDEEDGGGPSRKDLKDLLREYKEPVEGEGDLGAEEYNEGSRGDKELGDEGGEPIEEPGAEEGGLGAEEEFGSEGAETEAMGGDAEAMRGATTAAETGAAGEAAAAAEGAAAAVEGAAAAAEGAAAAGSGLAAAAPVIGGILLIIIIIFGSAIVLSFFAPSSPASENPVTNENENEIVQKIIKIAKDQLGKIEGDNNCNPYGPCEPWCADFVSWVYDKAGTPFTGGFDNGWRISSADGVRRYFQKNGIWIDNSQSNNSPPKPGYTVYYSYNHVDLVISVSGDSMTTIGGNEGRDGRVKQDTLKWKNNPSVAGFGGFKNLYE